MFEYAITTKRDVHLSLGSATLCSTAWPRLVPGAEHGVATEVVSCSRWHFQRRTEDKAHAQERLMATYEAYRLPSGRKCTQSR